MSELLELAARCEAAEGPDRGLECQIAKVLGWTNLHSVRGGNMGCEPNSYYAPVRIPKFTASLDAALTLVPEGLGYSICPTSVLLTRSIDDCGFMGRAATPALALCAAALRARSNQGDQ